MTSEPRFSLVVPIHNEEENVDSLLDELDEVLVSHGPFEVVAVDDASTDRSLELLRKWKERHAAPWLRVLRLRQKAGQSGAVMAGVDVARAAIVATVDGDLQNDPRDLPSMLARVESGEVDGVFGVRRQRRDTWMRRTSSRVGNRVRNWITGDTAFDAACGIKVVRRDYFSRVPRFVGMHRFMITLVRCHGGRVEQMDVNHRPRHAGRAKYGVSNRIWRGLRDCFAVRWLRSRALKHRTEEEY